jgi:uncharacterized membrane protein
MKSVQAWGTDPAITKSLKVTRVTFMMVASFTTLAAADAMVTLQIFNVFGQATILALTFFFVTLCASAIVADLIIRSGQTIATLRSLGATKSAVIKSVFMGILTSGLVGSVVGILLGAGLGAAVGVFGVQTSASIGGGLVSAIMVLVFSIAALGSGAYVGVRRTWRN